MIKQNVVDPVFEEFIANKCASFAKLKYAVTPDNTRYDFSLHDNKDIKVLAEIKTRTEWFPDWFIEDSKRDWLLKACALFRCSPWYVIHCLPNQTTYQINLHHSFDYSNFVMPDATPGILVDLKHWRIIPKVESDKPRMSPLDWK